MKNKHYRNTHRQTSLYMFWNVKWLLHNFEIKEKKNEVASHFLGVHWPIQCNKLTNCGCRNRLLFCLSLSLFVCPSRLNVIKNPHWLFAKIYELPVNIHTWICVSSRILFCEFFFLANGSLLPRKKTRRGSTICLCCWKFFSLLFFCKFCSSICSAVCYTGFRFENWLVDIIFKSSEFSLHWRLLESTKYFLDWNTLTQFHADQDAHFALVFFVALSIACLLDLLNIVCVYMHQFTS